MDLHTVHSGVHTLKRKKRVGRGVGSGHGKTASRGHKGQYSSAGANMPGTLFTGGQTPIHRRFPKRGFSNATWAKTYAEVNVGDLEKLPNRSTVDLATLKEHRILTGTFDGLRVLGNGELTKTLVIKAHHFTAGAKKKIEFCGGTCEVIAPPKPPVRNKMGQGKNSAKKKTPESK